MKPFITTLTGPSCAGKSTLEDALIVKGFAAITSVTTRAPRSGEVDGVDYHFITQEQMTALRENDQLVESVDFGHYSYAVTKEEIQSKAASGQPVVVVVEPNGRNQIAAYCEKMGWAHHAVYVGNPEDITANRFLKRMFSDIADLPMSAPPGAAIALFDTYSKRLGVMMTTERQWVNEAENQLQFNSVRPYSRILSHFDAGNQDAVVFSIQDAFYRHLCDGKGEDLAA